jgi:AcrR family transcriptional regulator
MARGEARDKLLAAAQDLFAVSGFERTTTREIAEAAGVDATLIARYFGSKTGLYLAALKAELGDGPPPDLLEPARMAALLGRVDVRGPGPVFQSAVAPHEDQEVQAQAREALHARLVRPLRDRFAQSGVDRPQLRAELAVAAFAGIALGRASGSFPELEKLPPADLLDLLQDLLNP